MSPGRVEVCGRWYGVRGRRFVRPALILYAADGDERRLLAELDDKPWEAQDGEPWRATFPLDSELDAVPALELSVAPDIVVGLRGQPPRRRRVPERRPRIPLGPPTQAVRTSADRADKGRPPTADGRAEAEAEAERFAARLATAQTALERERERRAEAEQALERKRTESRELSAELGRVRAELALAQAAEREAGATSDLLDSSRRDHRAAQARYDALAAEHERALSGQARLREELEARTGELDSARHALESMSEKLRSGEATFAGRSGTPAAREPRIATELPAGAAPAPVASPGRPLNPSLRSHSWPLRLLAVIVLAAVVIAVYVILRSTILH